MQFVNRIIARSSPSSYCCSATILSKYLFSKTSPYSSSNLFRNARVFSSESDSSSGGSESDEETHHFPWNTELGGGGGGGGSSSSSNASFPWDDSVSSWSTGLTKDHFDGEAIGYASRPLTDSRVGSGTGSGGGGGGGWGKEEGMVDAEASEDALERAVRERLEELVREAEASRLGNDVDVDVDDDEMDEETMRETSMLMRQITEPGARGAYLKDSEKAEMYKLHKENPEVYTVERLAKDFRIMRQRVVAILWLKELEEEEEKKLGEPLDDSVELLIDSFPE